MHEILHVMGIGISKSWRDNTNARGEFVGSESVAVGSPTNPMLALDEGDAHWRRGTKSDWNGIRQEALLAPAIAPGQRQMPTILDRAALRDVGWEEAIAGDANLDRVFDSSDLLTMFQAALFETGFIAGWKEGDFNADTEFDTDDLIAALATGSYVAAATPSDFDPTDPEAITVTYDRETGELHVDTKGQLLSTFEVRSADELFTGEGIELEGTFDVNRLDKVFKLDAGGFGNTSLGNVLPSELQASLLQTDLAFNGSYLQGGELVGVELRTVPEPSAVILLIVSCLGLLKFRTES